MNSERRHELQQNSLADFIGTQLKRIEPYTKLIAVAIALLAVAFVAWGLYRGALSGERSDATLELIQNASSGDPEALGSVGERFGNTTAGQLAKLYQADALLSAGIANLFDDREEAQTQLAEALRLYETVAAASGDTLTRSRAQLGVARTYESLGDVEQAQTAYRAVIAIDESDAITTLAEQRIEYLNSPMTQEFFAWFEQQDFSPADPALPPDLPSDTSLPSFPDLDLDDLSPLQVPDEMTPDPAAETPPSPETPAAPASPETPSEPTAVPAADPPAPAADSDLPAEDSPKEDAATEPEDAPAADSPAPDSPAEDTPAAEVPDAEAADAEAPAADAPDADAAEPESAEEPAAEDQPAEEPTAE